jgi:hypothetical protein
MWRALILRLALGAAAVSAMGGLAGLGLANYVESGSFHFYKQARASVWDPAPAEDYASLPAIEATDLAVLSPRYEPEGGSATLTGTFEQ